MRIFSFGLWAFFVGLLLFVPVVSSYDSELLGVSDLLFVVSQLGLEDIDVRADYSCDGVVDIFDLVLVASHIGLPRSDARRCVLDSPVPEGEFVGRYYSGMNFDELVLTRTDEVINFNWGAGSPASVVPANQFSVIWEGDFTFENGDYEFTATTDDGMRVFIDDELIIDEWRNQAATSYTAERSLSGTHRVRVEYYEDAGNAVAQVSWSLLVDIPTDPDPLLPSVTLTASPSTVSPGSSSTLSWDSSNADSCVASGAWSGPRGLSGSTTVTPSSTSTYTLSCTGNGETVSVSRTVTVSSGSAAGPTVQELFEYADTQEFRVDARNWYVGTNPDTVSEHIEIITGDSSAPYPFLENYMRYNFPDRSDVGTSTTGDRAFRDGYCGDFSIFRDFHGGLYHTHTNITEVWVEVWIRFSENFDIVAPSEWGCRSNADYKTQFVGTRGAGSDYIAGGRHGMHVANTFGRHFWAGTPNDVRGHVQSSDPWNGAEWFDGEWHRIRQYVRYPSQPNSGRYIKDGSTDTIHRVWLDDLFWAEINNYSTSHAKFALIRLGANMNQGPAEEMWVDRANVQIYLEDPGWDTSNPYHLRSIGE